LTVWLTGLQPDLLAAFHRLEFAAWLPGERAFAQGKDEDSSTLAGIRAIRGYLATEEPWKADKLYYMIQ
jgi:hypothetical protein